MQTDYWGVDVSNLMNKKLFLFDMDGTIYEENMVYEGTIDLLAWIEKIGGKYIFITNNSSRSIQDYIVKVRKMGMKADEDNFFTSGQATILYLKEKYLGAKVYCQGTASFIRELRSSGINVVEEPQSDIDIVLVGFDTELTSEKIRRTCELLQGDVVYIATNPDLRCPVSFGFIPDCGAICGMIECATGRKPLYIGKPEPVMVDIVRERFHYSKEETVVIGDRLYTDIATGHNAGVSTICVLTGEASVEDIKKEQRKPTYTFYSVKELFHALERNRAE